MMKTQTLTSKVQSEIELRPQEAPILMETCTLPSELILKGETQHWASGNLQSEGRHTSPTEFLGSPQYVADTD